MTRRLAALTSIGLVVAATSYPAIGFRFLNWDDQAVIVNNPWLEFPAVVGWSVSSTYMEHYQPLSWLAWAGVKSTFGLDPRAFHAANVVAHLAAVLLLWGVVQTLLARAAPHRPAQERDAVAWAAALLYGVHPLRVEVVAWISAMPYALALVLLLASFLAVITPTRDHWPWRIASLVLYAASLAARPVALGYPIVLVAVETCVFNRTLRASVARAWPFALLAVAAAAVEGVARTSGLNATPWSYRVQSAVTAPFIYVWRTVAPVNLTPLDLLPIEPAAQVAVVAAALLALAAISYLARRSRWATAAWVTYLALLLPAAGLVPSGLQVTADRYAYIPGLVIATAIAMAAARWVALDRARARGAAVVLGVVVAASALTFARTLGHWSNSITLWSRVVALTPRHDVGLYNLASALAEEGRSTEAMQRYRELLAFHADHALGRTNLDRLEAIGFEREGNDLAARGDLAAAADRYQQAIDRDPRRAHSHAARGMALASLGRSSEAVPSLREAIRQGIDDPAVPSALAVALLDGGYSGEARTVLESALARDQDDVGLAHNLARLLATYPEREGDALTALRLARAVVDATAGRDARALDTLAAAQAASGDRAAAAATSGRAAAVAASRGEHDLAVQITARGRAYRNPGQ